MSGGGLLGHRCFRKRLQLEYDLAKVFRRTEFLSAEYSGDIGSRSLDLLHVAAALEAGCRAFASFDVRQRKVAESYESALIPARG
jgi:predicted nucleic acid-binding protein